MIPNPQAIEIKDSSISTLPLTPNGNTLYKFKTVSSDERARLRIDVYSYLI